MPMLEQTEIQPVWALSLLRKEGCRTPLWRDNLDHAGHLWVRPASVGEMSGRIEAMHPAFIGKNALGFSPLLNR